MRKDKTKPVLRKRLNFYTDDLEYFEYLCKINNLSHTDMLREILAVYPQANANMDKNIGVSAFP